MAKPALIDISGIILPESYIWYDEEATSLYRVKQQVLAAGEFDSLQVNICSPGGYCREGWSIVDYLYGLGKPINTLAYGQCASFGTVIHAMGTVRETTRFCEWMYHRPWDMCWGNDLQIAKFNAGLSKETQKLFGFYAEQFGKSLDELNGLILEDDLYLSPQEVIDAGFATTLYKSGTMASAGGSQTSGGPLASRPGFNAPLDPAKKQKPVYMMSLGDRKINPDAPTEKDSQVKSTNTNAMAKQKQSLKAAAQSILDFISGKGPVDLDVALTDGRTMVTNSTGDAPVVGDTAQIDGTDAADGDYASDDFGTITVASGAITTITEEVAAEEGDAAAEGDTAAEPAASTDTVAAMAALRKENAGMKAQIKAQDDRIAEMGRRMTAVLGSITSEEPVTQANRTNPAARAKNSDGALSERDQMLAEHVAKFAPKAPATT